MSTSTSPGRASAIAACTIRLSSWPQRTVRAGPAAREPGTTWISGDVDERRARPAASWTVAVPSRASSSNASVTARSRPAASRAGTPPRSGSPSCPRSGARGCRAARRAARSRSARYACAFISAIAALFCSITGVMSTNVVGAKLQSSGWCGSKRRSSGGSTVSNALGTPAPGGERAGPLDGEEGSRVVRVERVAVGVRDQHVGRELADRSAIATSASRSISSG